MANEKIRNIWRAALAALALTLALTAPALAASDGTTTWRALLIGNSSYRDYRLEDLPSCAYDLAQMRSALTSGSVSYKKVSSLSSQTVAGLQSAVNAVATWGADEDDVTVFYYSGHGASSGLVGVDYNTTTGSGIYSFQLLQSALANVQGKVIILLDSCESGALIGKSVKSAGGGFTDNAIAAFSGASASSKGLGAKAITSGDHFHVIASSSQTQESLATASGKQYGFATNALCAAMGWQHSGSSKSGNKLTNLEGDLNGDLTVTVGEAFAYASEVVSKQAEAYIWVQDMQIYPAGSTQKLIARAGSSREASKPAPSGSINFPKACIAPNMTLQLRLTNPDATYVNWGTTNSSIAKVDPDTGLVTGVKANLSVTPVISVTYKLNGTWYTATCKVRVLPARYVVQSVRLKMTTLSLVQGKSYTMPVRFSPASALYKSLIWTSSDPSVATVSSGGKITAVANSGNATITATAISGATASVVVTATPAAPTSVTLNYKTRTLIPGQTFMLTETVLPVIAADKKVTWDSNRKDVATVDDTGLVTAVGVGKATISATTTANGKRATCVVTVVPNQSIPRTSPKSASGKLVSSARKIYESGTGSLVIEMYFYNRTRYSQTIPAPNPGLIVLKLKSGTRIPVTVTSTTTKALRSGTCTTYKFMLNYEDYPQLMHLSLLGSDALYEAVN